MEPIEIGPWRILVDPEATARAHAQREAGAPEECECAPCRNLVLARRVAYPAPLRDMLGRLGVPVDRESEVYHLGRKHPGLHWYGGWYHFVGHLEHGPDRTHPFDQGEIRFVPLTDTTGVCIGSSPAVVPDQFDGLQILQFEYQTEAPWLLAEEEPD